MTAHVTLDEDTLRSLLTAVRDTSWSWTEDEVPALAERFGWTLVEVLPGLGAVADPGYGLGAKAFLLHFDKGKVWKVRMRVSSRVAEDDPAGQAFLEGVFADVQELGAEVFGRPASPYAATVPQVRWHGEQTTLAVQNLRVAVTLTWATNAPTRTPPTPRRTEGEMLVTPPPWQELTQALGARLPRLEDGDTVILEHGDFYAQCQMAEVCLHADIVSNHHLPPEHQLCAEQEERLRAMGWVPPDPPKNFNWHVEVPVPMSDGDGVRLAEMMVGALREVYGIDRVDLLQERAFNALC